MVDYTQRAVPWRPLVKIADVVIDGVPAQDIQWSTEDGPLSDGTFWEGRILDMSSLDQQLGRILESQFVLPDITLSVKNEDDRIRELVDENDGFGGKVVTIFMGFGKIASNFEVRFTGQVPISNAIDWDDERVVFHFQNTFEVDSIALPKNKIFSSSYPNAEDKSLFKPIPEVLGSFQTTDGGGEVIPAFGVDTTVGVGGQFTCAQHMDSIEDVYINGASANYTVNQLSGPTLFTLNEAYDTETDIITVNGVGRTSTLLGKNLCVEWVKDIIEQSWGMGLTSSKTDAAAFTSVATMGASGEAGRRWIGKDIQTRTLLGELGNDGFFDLIINEDGEYEPVFRYAGAPASTPIYREADLLPRGTGRSFRVQRDPEGAYANQFPYNFRLKPGFWEGVELNIGGDFAQRDFAQSDEINDTAEQTSKDQIVRRRLKFKWLYELSGAADRGTRERMASSTVIEMAEIVTEGVGLDQRPTGTFQLIYSKYEILSTLGTSFMVRNFSPDFMNLTAGIFAWNLDNLSPKRYQADGSPDWSGATDYAKEVDGFYEQNSDQIYF